MKYATVRLKNIFNYEVDGARRNPELNKKISIIDQLSPYKDDPSYFISFTDINKIGLNPSTTYDTPLGIYTYPLKEIWNDFVNNEIPFAGDRTYVQLLCISTSKILDETYSESSYRKDMMKIKKLYMSENYEFKNNNNISPKDKKHSFAEFIDEAEGDAFSDKPISLLWNVTRLLSKLLIPPSSNKVKEITTWNRILRMLGYNCALDRNGLGFIHRNEPIQAVFFTLTSVEHIATFLNKKYSSIHPKKAGEIKNSKLFGMFDSSQDLDVVNKIVQKRPDLIQTLKGIDLKVTINNDRIIFYGGTILSDLRGVTLRSSNTSNLNVAPKDENPIYLEDCIIDSGFIYKTRIKRGSITGVDFKCSSIRDADITGGTFNLTNTRRCSIKNASFLSVPKFIESCIWISGKYFDADSHLWFSTRKPLLQAVELIDEYKKKGGISYLMKNARSIQNELMRR